MSDPEQAIRTLFEGLYPQAVAANDQVAYLALYTPNALWIRPGSKPRVGHAAIAEGFAEMMAGESIIATFAVSEIERHGGSATVLGHSEAVIVPDDGGDQKWQSFHALWIVRERHGQWLIHRQIWAPTL
jgi:uncharacterized protein (TIGR02246 family)